MLDIEAKAHNALRATAGDRGHYSDPVAASRELSARIAPVVQAARQAARRVAAQRMQAEVDALHRDGGPQVHLPRIATPGAADLIAAERASRMYGDALLRQAQRLLDDADRVSAAELSRGTDGALIDIANTEVPHAFNDERRRIERATKERYEGTSWYPLMAKMYDATLDRRTCPRCKALDGKWRPLGIDFAGKAQAPMHARCRCVVVLIISPLFLGRREADEAA